ncbi:MAG TPA: Gfo/Idh/MocA family oxidoreductase, partial [Candidatus Acidoferrales bacterium]|nr:Gfo/Idh/MocA family oxidoreductase [Candidatus Acidoferrales bacterium]
MTAVTQAGKTRVAVVGTGEFGRNHARVYREIHNAELVGVYDKDSARAQAAASEFRAHAFAALDELAGRADAVSV